MSDPLDVQTPFNTSLESGLRTLCILGVDEDYYFDLQHLLAFDHIVVHSGDVPEAPPSLHVAVPQRNGELLIRRTIVEEGLLLMESKGLLKRQHKDDGVFYGASDFTSIFLSSLTSEYIKKLRTRAQWAVNIYSVHKDNFFEEVFNIAFDRWTTEFQFSQLSLGEI